MSVQAAVQTAKVIEFKPVRRVVSKAFDGEAAMNALLLKRVGANDLYQELAIAEGLLRHGLTHHDVEVITGLPEKIVVTAARHLNLAPRAGRRPSSLGVAFASPLNHLRLSVFLGAIEHLVPGLVKQSQPVTGAALLAAFDYTEHVCGSHTYPQMSGRYHLTAIHHMQEGGLALKTCPRCRTRYVIARNLALLGEVAHIGGGACPFCRHLRQLKPARTTHAGCGCSGKVFPIREERARSWWM